MTMKKEMSNFTWLLFILLFIILLIITRQLLHATLSDVTLFVNYKSAMGNNLLEITNMMETPIFQPSIEKTVFHAFVIGGVFSLSIVYLFIYMTKRKRISSLYFALAGLFLGIRLSFTKETLYMRSFIDVAPDTMTYADLLTGMLALLFFMLFYWREFIDPKYNKYQKVLAFHLIIYIIALLIFPLNILIETFFVYQILAFFVMAFIVYFTVITIIKNKSIPYLNIIGFTLVFILSWNDVLGYSETISTNDFIIFSVFVYFNLLAFHLGSDLSKSYDEIEILTSCLQQVNTSLEETVEKRTTQLITANIDLKKAEEERNRLLANVSHELNTPITMIQGYIKAMLDEVIPRTDTAQLRAVYDDTILMALMIQDLQELSMMELGHVTFEPKKIDIDVFMRQIYEENLFQFEAANIELLYQEIIPSGNHRALVVADPIRLKQVVQNLLINAKKYTPYGGRVTMYTSLSNKSVGEGVYISVVDTGEGIRSEDMPYVFERLYRINNETNGKYKGSGLGLAISKEIIEYHAGEIGVESEYGKGSTFYFTLPLKGEVKNEWQSISS